MENRYKHVVYDVAKFYIAEGMYSIKELEDLIIHECTVGKMRQEALSKAMREMKNVSEETIVVYPTSSHPGGDPPEIKAALKKSMEPAKKGGKK